MSKPLTRAIKFVNNWNNKLDCKAFLEMLPADDERLITGETFNIYLEEHGKPSVYLGLAELKYKKRISKSSLTSFTTFLCTGYPAEPTKKILDRLYNKGKDLEIQIDLCLLVWVKREPSK